MTVIESKKYLQPNPTPEEQDELEKRVVECAKSHGADWPMFVDQQFHKQWSVKRIPSIFAIDRKGILRSTSAREMLEETVDELLKEDTSDT